MYYQEMPDCPDFYKKIALINNMRMAWEQHVYWNRLLLISTAERLKDLPDVTERLLQNPYDIASIFMPYYGNDAAARLASLITEHLQIGAELITALRNNKNDEAGKLNKEWCINAGKMAEAFSRLNPNYNLEELRGMMRRHLELASQETEARLAGNYRADIEAFNKAEKEAIMMADYFTFGIMKQFPHKFT